MIEIPLKQLTPCRVFNAWYPRVEGGISISNGRETFDVTEAGGVIWSLINGRNSLEDIIRGFGDYYEESFDEVCDDVCAFIQSFEDNSIIVLDYNPLFKLGTSNDKVPTCIEHYGSNSMGAVDVLFLVPPSPHIVTNAVPILSVSYSLGVGYLYALTEKEFPSLKLGFLNLWPAITTEKDLSEVLVDLSPKVLAISCMTDNFQNGVRIARLARNLLGGSTEILMGGPHVTFDHQGVLEESIVDYCFLGESERSFLAYLDAKFGKDSGTASPKCALRNLDGIAFLDNGQKIVNPPGKHLMDLDELPIPTIFHTDRYAALPILSSRGCPFQCRFCAAGIMSGHRYRLRSIDSVVNEMFHRYQTTKISTFHFCDDSMTIIPERTLEFCEKVTALGIPNLRWFAESRVDVIVKHPGLPKRMKEAGCIAIQFGIEAGSDKKLDSIGKKTSIQHVLQALQIAMDAGLQVKGSMVIGLPGEDQTSIRETIEFAKMINDKFGVNPAIGWFVPYPGTYFAEHLDDYHCTCIHGENYDNYSMLAPNILSNGESLYELLSLYHTSFGPLARKTSAAATWDFLEQKNKISYKDGIFSREQ